MKYFLIGKRKPTTDQPKAVTVVWDGTHEGSLLIGRARHGSKDYLDGVLESLRANQKAPVVWHGMVQVPEGWTNG